MNKLRWICILQLFIFISCSKQDYYSIPLYSNEHRLQAVIEIPSGTSYNIDYCHKSNRFKFTSGLANLNSEKVHPFNIGFIPSTTIQSGSSDPGSPLKVIILSEPMKTGSIVEVLPLGIVSARHDNKVSNLIIAIPFSSKARIIEAENYSELISMYPGMIKSIEAWLCQGDSLTDRTNFNWQDEVLASKLIDNQAVNKY